MYLFRLIPLFALVCLCACESDGPEAGQTETVDRTALLEHWADNVILPAYLDYRDATAALHEAALAYSAEPTEAQLSDLRAEFVTAYRSWQRVSPFVVGPGEELRLREQSNIYPTDTARLVSEETPNLELPSNVDIQGFPALDYLLHSSRAPAQLTTAITLRTSRLADLAAETYTRWTDGYRDAYVAAGGSNATASVDRTVNDFIFWYEKYLRAGKVGIPAGVFSSNPMPGLAEAPFQGELSKTLFLEGLEAAEDFFTTSPGLGTYLDELNVERDGQPLSDRIEANFAAARTAAAPLDADFATQVATDNTAMLQLYDALQRNVILLKVDMLQALNINVDYVDADGD